MVQRRDALLRTRDQAHGGVRCSAQNQLADAFPQSGIGLNNQDGRAHQGKLDLALKFRSFQWRFFVPPVILVPKFLAQLATLKGGKVLVALNNFVGHPAALPLLFLTLAVLLLLLFLGYFLFLS